MKDTKSRIVLIIPIICILIIGSIAFYFHAHPRTVAKPVESGILATKPRKPSPKPSTPSTATTQAQADDPDSQHHEKAVDRLRYTQHPYKDVSHVNQIISRITDGVKKDKDATDLGAGHAGFHPESDQLTFGLYVNALQQFGYSFDPSQTECYTDTKNEASNVDCLIVLTKQGSHRAFFGVTFNNPKDIMWLAPSLDWNVGGEISMDGDGPQTAQ